MELVSRKLETPIGTLTLIANAHGLTAVLWPEDPVGRVNVKARAENSQETHPVLELTSTQLTEYFAGHRREFDVPLAPRGTDFQKEVWRALAEIPFGETRSYGDIARRIRRPKAVRAVGGANGRNPISIIVPCHRVVGATGALTGFAGGLRIKEYLLRLEQSSR